jgi:hypothetical protein
MCISVACRTSLRTLPWVGKINTDGAGKDCNGRKPASRVGFSPPLYFEAASTYGRSPPNPTNTTPTNRQTLLTSSGKTR